MGGATQTQRAQLENQDTICVTTEKGHKDSPFVGGLRNQLQIDIQAEALPSWAGRSLEHQGASRGTRERQPDFDESYFAITHDLRLSNIPKSSLCGAKTAAGWRN